MPTYRIESFLLNDEPGKHGRPAGTKIETFWTGDFPSADDAIDWVWREWGSESLEEFLDDFRGSMTPQGVRVVLL